MGRLSFETEFIETASEKCKIHYWQVPDEWQEDRRWREAGGAGLRNGPTHKAKVPSRWVPVPSALQRPDPDREHSEGTDIKVVDRFVVPKKRAA